MLEALEHAGLELLAGPQASGEWIVLHTRSRQEKALARDVRAMGTACWLPLIETVRYYGRHKVRVNLPLFPGYLFIKGTLEQAYAADRTRRVAQVLRVPDQERFGRELMMIHRVLHAGGELEPHPFLSVGTWAEVTAGPFRGTVGLVNEALKNGRLILQIQALGQASSLEIEAGLLRPLEMEPDPA